MSDLLQLLPIYAFMLIPVWIPIATMTVGAISDAVKAPARPAGHHRAVAAERRNAEASAQPTTSAPLAA